MSFGLISDCLDLSFSWFYSVSPDVSNSLITDHYSPLSSYRGRSGLECIPGDLDFFRISLSSSRKVVLWYLLIRHTVIANFCDGDDK